MVHVFFFNTHASRVNPSRDATRFGVAWENARISKYQGLRARVEASF